jgi:hypothetical protein
MDLEAVLRNKKVDDALYRNNSAYYAVWEVAVSVLDGSDPHTLIPEGVTVLEGCEWVN